MLYLHCGWPKTGTTTLQAALVAHRDDLAAAGILHPQRWLSPLGRTHHGLAELVKASLTRADAFDDFRRFIADHEESDIVFSAEQLSFWLISEARREALMAFLAVARESAPTRCVWTVRRYDELLSSLYMWLVRMGSRKLPPPAEFLEDHIGPNNLLVGMMDAEAVLDGEVAYVKYNPEGTHNFELVDALGIRGPVASRIGSSLASGRRLNARPTSKQSAALRDPAALSSRVGVELDSAGLRRAVFDEGLEFDRDEPYRPVSGEVADAAHQRMLAAARRDGFGPYEEFFGEAEIDLTCSASAGLEAFTEEDLALLADRFGGVVRG